MTLAATTLSDHIALLREYNAWRRHDSDQPLAMPDPREIGIAIDAVCDAADQFAGTSKLVAPDHIGDVNKMVELEQQKAAAVQAALVALRQLNAIRDALTAAEVAATMCDFSQTVDVRRAVLDSLAGIRLAISATKEAP